MAISSIHLAPPRSLPPSQPSAPLSVAVLPQPATVATPLKMKLTLDHLLDWYPLTRTLLRRPNLDLTLELVYWRPVASSRSTKLISELLLGEVLVERRGTWVAPDWTCTIQQIPTSTSMMMKMCRKMMRRWRSVSCPTTLVDPLALGMETLLSHHSSRI